MSDKPAIGNVVKQFRKSLNKTQAQFGRDLAVTKQCISNWELNKRVPSIDYFRNLTVCFSDWRKEFAEQCLSAMINE